MISRYKIPCFLLAFFSVSISAVSQAPTFTTLPGTGFQKQFTGAGADIFWAVESFSSGFVMAGSSNSYSLASKDMIVTKVDPGGTVVWSKAYGGSGDDEALDMKRTTDGGFILTGYSRSFSGTGMDNFNLLLVKLDGGGNVQWSKIFGGNNMEIGYSVIQTSDNGYAVTGVTKSFGSCACDVLVIRTDNTGNLIWMKAIGGAGNEIGRGIIQTSGGDYLINGSTDGFGSPGQLIHLLKIDAAGTPLWSRKIDYTFYTGSKKQTGYGLIQNNSGDYVFTGKAGEGNIGDASMFIISTNTAGVINWSENFIMNSGDGGSFSIQQTSDNGYLLGGYMGNYYLMIVKTTTSGAFSWSRRYSDMSFFPVGRGACARQTSDGGFILAGYSINAGDTNQVIVKADSNGDNPCYTTSMTPIGGGLSYVTSTTSCSSSTGGVTNTVALITTTLSGVINVLCDNLSTSLEESPAEGRDFSIYPNPASNKLTIESGNSDADGCVAAIYTMAGRKLKELPLTDRYNLLDLSEYEKGLYFIGIHDRNGGTRRTFKAAIE